MKAQLFSRMSFLAVISLLFSTEAVYADDVVAKAFDIKDVSELDGPAGGAAGAMAWNAGQS